MAKKFLQPIPTWPAPEDTKCVMINIPNDVSWFALFWGFLENLGWSNIYERDDAHTAAQLARYWRAEIAAARERFLAQDCCNMNIEFQQAGDCTLQVRFDGGEWVDIFNAQVCADTAAERAIQDALDNGEISPVGQTSGQGTLATDECKTFSFALKGKDRYLIPVPVKHGYTVRVFDLQGIWSDGSLGALSPWNCPDGDEYGLGECSVVQAFLGTDPLPETPHMRVILVGDDIAQDPTGEEGATISGDIGDLVNVYLQANDAPIDDNLGEIRGKVEVCEHTDFEWECVYDFEASESGFAAYEDAFTEGVWSLGVGWSAVYGTETSGAHRNIVDILRSFTAVNLVYLKLEFDYTLGGADIMASTAWRVTLDSDTLINVPFDSVSSGTGLVVSWEGDITGDSLELLIQPARNSGDTGSAVIKKLTIRGNGDSPC